MSVSSYQNILDILKPYGVQLVAVSKTKSVEEIQTLYNQGQRDFGENYVQELMEKEAVLPKDIRWHFIGHLQTNKVKYIAPFVHMIQSVDSLKLLLEIDKHAAKNQRVILCLLQIFIAREESKFGLDEAELDSLILTVNQNRENARFSHSVISGCMGMATLTENQTQIRDEFNHLRKIFEIIKTSFTSDPVNTLSMGMSNDYLIAMEAGSTMVRIGSLLFGKR
ncbi:MAG TPA: YggS family pyridoxal phosphate-dependent enzyme [Puia sp.]|jgi:pyridoxal phosphate enzyme (YggS family)|nr:YggS family pyridoxal phosphate-dependent enzyme [Puia sp.]